MADLGAPLTDATPSEPMKRSKPRAVMNQEERAEHNQKTNQYRKRKQKKEKIKRKTGVSDAAAYAICKIESSESSSTAAIPQDAPGICTAEYPAASDDRAKLLAHGYTKEVVEQALKIAASVLSSSTKTLEHSLMLVDHSPPASQAISIPEVSLAPNSSAAPAFIPEHNPDITSKGEQVEKDAFNSSAFTAAAHGFDFDFKAQTTQQSAPKLKFPESRRIPAVPADPAEPEDERFGCLSYADLKVRAEKVSKELEDSLEKITATNAANRNLIERIETTERNFDDQGLRYEELIKKKNEKIDMLEMKLKEDKLARATSDAEKQAVDNDLKKKNEKIDMLEMKLKEDKLARAISDAKKQAEDNDRWLEWKDYWQSVSAKAEKQVALESLCMKKDQFLRRTVPTCFLIMALAFLTFIYPGLPSINSTTLNTYNLQPSNLPSPYEFGNSEPITSITATYVTILSVMNIPASDVDALPITDQNDTFIPATDVPPTDPEADGCSSSLFSEIKACFHAPSPARCIKGVITDWLTDLTAKVRSAEWLKKWESSSEKDQAEDVPKPLPTSTTKPDLSPTGTLPTADEYLHLLRAIMLSA